MQIFQIISPDGYVTDLFEQDEDTGILSARFHFPLVSDYMRAAIREGKPYLFTGRSGNARSASRPTWPRGLNRWWKHPISMWKAGFKT